MTERWTAPARPGSVSDLRNRVVAVVVDAGAPRAVADDVKLAVSEALTNAVLHAYRDGAAGDVHVAVTRSDGHVEVVVDDDGIGPLPRPDSPGIGVGLPLIATLAASSAVETRPSGGTRVRMRFALAG